MQQAPSLSLSLVCPFQARLVNVSERSAEPPQSSVCTYAPAVAAAEWRATHESEAPVEDDRERHMMSPYRPPDVVTFYESPPQQQLAAGGDEVVDVVVEVEVEVENRDDRSYTFFESFYPEAPMTHTELYPTPLEEVYGAKEFAQTWSAYNEPPAPPEPQMVVNIVVEDTPPQIDVNHNEMDSKRPPDGDVVGVLWTDVERSATDAGGDDGMGGTEVFSRAGCDVVVVKGDRGDVPSDDEGGDTASDLREAPSADGETVSAGEWCGLASGLSSCPIWVVRCVPVTKPGRFVLYFNWVQV